MLHRLFRSKTKIALAVAGLAGGFFIFGLFGSSSQVSAAALFPVTCPHVLYFGGNAIACGSAGTDVDPGHFSASTAKSTFISQVESSPARDFYVDVVIGKAGNGGGGHDHPSAADITDFENRVNNPQIGIRLANSSTLGVGCNNTMKVGSDYTSICETLNFNSIVLYNVGNGAVYTIIKIDCGNPLNSTPLPVAVLPWDVEGSSSVSPATVNVGGTVTFLYDTLNEGPGPATYCYQNHYQWHYRNGTLGADTPIGGCPVAVNSPAGTHVGSPPWTVGIPVDPTVSQLCSWEEWSPHASNNGAVGVSSPPSCVTINDNWALSATTTAAASSGQPVLFAGGSVTFSSVLANDNEGGYAHDFCYGPRYYYSATDKTGSTAVAPGEIGGNTNPSGTCDGYLAPSQTWGPNVYTTQTANIPSTQPAGWICGTFAFDPASSAGARNGRSPAKCIQILPQPTFTCGTSTFPTSAEINTPLSFTVSANMGMAWDGRLFTSPTNPKIVVTVTGPSGNVPLSPTGNPAPYPVPTGNVITTNNLSFTPTVVGQYTVHWTMSANNVISTANCGATQPPLLTEYRPYFKVLSGDVAAGVPFSNASGPTTTCTALTPAQAAAAQIKSWNYDAGNYYGAGTQGAAYAVAGINSFVTSLNPNAISTDASALQQSLSNHPYDVSFADTPTPAVPNYGGNFGSLGCSQDYVSKALTAPSLQTIGAGTIDVTTLTDSTNKGGTFKINGDITLIGSVPAGRKITLIVSGKVYIPGDVTYQAATTVPTIPYLAVLDSGNNIYVGKNVNNLYGFYDAQPSGGSGGGFFTCASGAGAEAGDYGTCSTNQLHVYGAVAGNSIDLDRSYGTLHGTGAGAQSNQSAELFQYGPQLWLGSVTTCSTVATCLASNGITYKAISSLPPVL